MEIGLTIAAMALFMVVCWLVNEARKTYLMSVDLLGVMKKDLVRILGDQEKVLDKLSESVDNLCQVEQRLARKEEVRSQRDRLAEVREGGWKGV